MMSSDHPRCECHSCTQSRLRQFERQATVPHSVMASQINAAVMAERERCAKLAEGLAVGITTDPLEDWYLHARRIAAKIRGGQ